MGLACVVAGASTAARAQYGARAEVASPWEETAARDQSAAQTRVVLDALPMAATSLAEAGAAVPGARFLQSGGLGAATRLSLRGTDPAHTEVFYGSLPLLNPDGSPVDLALIPPAAVHQVVVYRGMAPTWLGARPIGGVVQLLPPRLGATEVEAQVQAGSFGQAQGGVGARAAVGAHQALTHVGAGGARNDFPLRDDGGTRFVPEDDVTRRRRNAQVLQGHALGRWAVRLGQGELHAFLLALEQRRGAPGAAVAEARQTQQLRQRTLMALGWGRDLGSAEAGRVEVDWASSVGRARFSDPFGEFGRGPTHSDDRSQLHRARLAWRRALSRWLDLISVGTLELQHYRPQRAGQTRADTASVRIAPALAVETRLHGRVRGLAWALRPSVGLVLSHVRSDPATGEAEARRRQNDVLPAARVGLTLSPAAHFSLLAAAGQAWRNPTFLERFGDRATLLANPDLEPERGRSVEGGARWRPRAGSWHAQLETRVFALQLDDLIRYRRTSQFTAIAENIASGSIVGVETGWQNQWGAHLRDEGQWTFVHSRDEAGLALPLRPPWQLFWRPSVHSGRRWAWVDAASLFAELQVVSANFVDPANLVVLPARLWWSVGGALVWAKPGLRLSVVMRDVADARGSDLLGFPLPGRRFA
ncbi:MAG: TonB-dependent receptor plug domain-containing protein, partial [Polyangiales bacterium]